MLTIFLQTLIFRAVLKLTGRIESIEISHIPSFYIIYTRQQSGTFVTTDKPTLTHLYHPKLTLGVTPGVTQSMAMDEYIMMRLLCPSAVRTLSLP